MNDPRAPINPATGKRDWDYTPPKERHNESSFSEDDDDEFESEGEDPYEGREDEEPFC